MPNPVLAEVIDKNYPKFIDNVVTNLSTTWTNSFMSFLDSIIRSAIRSAPPEFNYEGYRITTPEEEFHALLNSSIDYETAPTDVTEVVLMFSFNGELIERPLYRPFTNRFGVMRNAGTPYVFTPVLTDSVISPDNTKVFVRLLKDKVNFESVIYNIHVDGQIRTATIVYAETMLRSKKATNMLGKKAVTPIGFYPFASYGIAETFRRYYGIENVIITDDVKVIEKLKKTHRIWSGLGRKPKWLNVKDYSPNTYSICVDKKYEETYIHIVSALIYAFDMIPDMIPSIVKAFNKGDVATEKLYNSTLLGRIAYRDGFSLTRCIEGVEEHFNALEGYLDTLIQIKLKELGIEVNDFIDFIVYIVSSFSEWLLKGKTFSNNIYNRYLDVLYYISYNIIVGVNKTINTLVKKKGDNLTRDNVQTILSMSLGRRDILNLTRSSQHNIALTMAQTTNENYYYTVTSLLELQERGEGVNRAPRNKFPVNAKSVTGPDIYLGTSLFLPKKTPTPRVRLNPFCNIDINTGKLLPPPDIKKTLDLLDVLFSGRDNATLDKQYLIEDTHVEEREEDIY